MKSEGLRSYRRDTEEGRDVYVDTSFDLQIRGHTEILLRCFSYLYTEGF